MSDSIKDYRRLIEEPWGKMFYDMIFRQLSIDDSLPLKILDFGSGFCFTSNHYAKYHNVVAIEPNTQMSDLRFCDNKYTLIIGGIKEIKMFNNNSFDVVICHNVLEYADNKREILQELSRVLKKGGRLSIIKHNTAGKVFSQAVFADNPAQALKILEEQNKPLPSVFGDCTLYDYKQIKRWAKKCGLNNTDFLGIRTFFGLSDKNSIKYTNKWYYNMLELEMRVCNIEEYKNTAFYHHLIFTKE